MVDDPPLDLQFSPSGYLLLASGLNHEHSENISEKPGSLLHLITLPTL